MAAVTSNPNQARARRVAVKRVEGFAKQFGEAHRNLARHAAFPLSLTPDLLYQIWANFVPEAPWEAVAHLLLSRLCRQVGYEMYEMDICDRNLLLRELKEQFGQERLDELAEFLLDYVAQRLTDDDPDTQSLAEAQEWTALAYTKPNQAARELAEAFRLSVLRVKPQDRGEILRLASLVETFAEPLQEAGFEPLLSYAQGMASFARGNVESAANSLNKGIEGENSISVVGVILPIPKQLKAIQHKRSSSNLAENFKQMESRQEGKNSPCAVILTAIPVEYKAVRAHLSDLQEEAHWEGTIYERGIFSSNGHSWQVGIVEMGAGIAEAAVETKRAIDYFKPSVVLFVGVAGGLKDVAIGDVVAATKVYGYESGKVIKETFLPRPNVSQVSYVLEQRAKAEARKEDWLKRIKEPIPKTKPRAFIGAIAAGDKVVASTKSDVYQLLRTNYGDALAVEMESHGFLKAVRANPEINALIIRGISDLIDGKSNADAAGSQEKAAQHASAFAFEILAGELLLQVNKELKTPEPNFVWKGVQTLKGHSELVRSVAISPSGQILASSSNDQTIKLWNLPTGKLLYTLAGHSSMVTSVAFSPDGKTLASSSNLAVGDGNIKLWDVETGTLQQTLDKGLLNLRVSCVTFSPDGNTLASGNIDATIKLWQLNSGKLHNTLKGHGWDVNSVAFSRNGKILVSGGLDGAIKIWNWRTGELLHTLNRPSPSDIIGSLVSWFDSSVGVIWSVAISPDGQMIASGGSEQPIMLWNSDRGKLVRTLTEHSGKVYSVTFSPNGKLLASGGDDNTLRIWNYQTGELIQTLEHLSPVYCVTFSPDGQTLVSGSVDSTIKVWRIHDS
ncbi:MAG: hypothetical protein RLP02_17590 [Coleofasciculus sp. C2-GNP5-27]